MFGLNAGRFQPAFVGRRPAAAEDTAIEPRKRIDALEKMKPNEESTWIRTVRMTAPSLADNTADADRLAEALASRLAGRPVDIDLDLIQTLPDRLRSSGYHVRCVVFRRGDRWVLAGVVPDDEAVPVCGLACDLGTTRVVLRLVNLAGGEVLGGNRL